MIRDISEDLSGGVESRHAGSPCKHGDLEKGGLMPSAHKLVCPNNSSGVSVPPAQNILPVERDSSARAAKQSQKPFVRISGKSHGRAGFARDGQKHSTAEVRAERARLRSRIRILKKAKERTHSWNCSELYRKAIRAAEFDIQELTI